MALPAAVPDPPVPFGRHRSSRPRRMLVVGLVGLVGLASVACSTGGGDDAGGAGTVVMGPAVVTGGEGSAPPCPTEAVAVTVTVDQWGDIVARLAGACGDVTTVVTGASGDPHDFEPTPADAAAFSDARLVVVNGLGYDAWATKLLDSASGDAEVVDAGVLAGRTEGDNPHVWYDPATVEAVAGAVTERLTALAPDAAAYFSDRAAEWDAQLGELRQLIGELRSSASGRSFAATESVFDDMAAAIGLTDATPAGYRQAAANGSEPAPGDLAAFEQVLGDRQVDVLVVNTQTEGALIDQLRGRADDAGVAVVEVSETLPDEDGSFVAWQLRQLRALATALGVG